MPVIVQHVYIAQCQWCDWESVGKLNESAARREERTHVAHEHGAKPWHQPRVDPAVDEPFEVTEEWHAGHGSTEPDHPDGSKQ